MYVCVTIISILGLSCCCLYLCSHVAIFIKAPIKTKYKKSFKKGKSWKIFFALCCEHFQVLLGKLCNISTLRTIDPHNSYFPHGAFSLIILTVPICNFIKIKCENFNLKFNFHTSQLVDLCFLTTLYRFWCKDLQKLIHFSSLKKKDI